MEMGDRGRGQVDQLAGSWSSRGGLAGYQGDTGGAIPPRIYEDAYPITNVDSLQEGPSTRRPRPIRTTTLLPYEETKRHCRIFFLDKDLPASPISASSEESEYEEYFQCLICFEEMVEDDGVHLLPCAHGLCRACLLGHVCSKIEERRFPVFCPLCMAEPGNATPSVISGGVVQQLDMSEDQYAIWAELEMAHLSVQIRCHKLSTYLVQELSAEYSTLWTQTLLRWIRGVGLFSETDGLEALSEMQNPCSEKRGMQPYDLRDARMQLPLSAINAGG
ncbi:hypothetical protein BU15DRAFT_78808 [Melanogaster broomeanus]|nr:hypothetical protein BU15DRAFT_78808 [Melanogaster broomeanus]